MKKIVIIGAGASGLMAAIQAASGSGPVTLIEKMGAAGRKLRITGKGRCNLTNSAGLKTFVEQFHPDGRFLYSAFHRFFSEDLIRFFEESGVPCKTERGGRVFPLSDSAGDIVDALSREVARRKVRLVRHLEVKKIEIRDGKVTGVYGLVNSGKDRGREMGFDADAVILCCGGASYPRTGSSGDGFQLAGDCGHRIVPVRPSLVPLRYSDSSLDRLDGLELKHVRVHVKSDGNIVLSEFGDVTFLDQRVSGPVILKISRSVVDRIDSGQRISLIIDLKPAVSEEKLENRINRECESYYSATLEKVLRSLMPEKLVNVCCCRVGLDRRKPVSGFSREERSSLMKWLKAFEIAVSGYGTFDEAIMTAGGVALDQVNPRTMESRIVKGLFFAGEVLDLDANTGGYNLQAAFSTGWLAGISSCM